MNKWDNTKKLVYERDKHICKSCGKYPSSQVHHIIPRSEGGKDDLNNLITLCGRCHMLVSPVPDAVLLRLWKIKPDDFQNQKNKVFDRIQELNNYSQ